MSALGQKQTCALQNLMSALPPIATAKADMPQMVMSALPPKAEMCGATGDVRFGPIADSCTAAKGTLFDHVIDDGENAGRNGEAECPCGREVDNELEFGRLHHRQVSGLGALKDAAAIDAD